jgi:Fe-S cluster assembly protein SufB
MAVSDLDLGRYKLGWNDDDAYVFRPEKGLNTQVVADISAFKGEPRWMTDFRLKSLRTFDRKPMLPWFAQNMPDIDFQDIYYYIKPTDAGVASEWDEVPEAMKRTYERLGIPEAERKYLAGVTAQYECLRGGTEVWTTKGLRPIKALGRGDEVFALDEATGRVVVAPVVAGAYSGDKEVFEIHAGASLIGASANHPFLVRRGGRSQWVPVEQLRSGDKVAIAAGLPDYGTPFKLFGPLTGDPSSLPTVTTDALSWWAGAFLARGYVHDRDGYLSVEIDLAGVDHEWRARIEQVSHELLGLELLASADGRRLVAKGSGALGSFLQLNGLASGADAKRVPDWVHHLPRSQRVAFLAGAGHPTDPTLAPDLAILRRMANEGGGDGAIAFVTVDSITPVGVEPVYDIEVAGHHNFVAEGFVVHNSEVVYHKNREDLASQGILFCDMDTALREYPELVKKHFGTVIPPGDNKFAALNSSVWSGGSFIYIPPGVECEMPLQAYFRINSENAGQFERTLIIADEGAKVHYIEGCSAPVYTNDSLHSAVVEIIVKPSARVTYTTIQNWSPNVYNLVTKRAKVEAEGHMEWIDGNIGSKLTMKYPSVYLVGPKATGEVLSVAYAGAGQHQDAGAKMIHAAPETTSKIVSKSISKDGGITTYRGLVRVDDGAYGCKSHVQCDALILDEDSTSRTLPYMEVGERDAQIGHEATVSKVADEQLFYLMSRGLSQEQAMGMIVNGFIEPVTKTLPMEYAVEWSRLIELQMEGSVG